jgi:hypothetical protein
MTKNFLTLLPALAIAGSLAFTPGALAATSCGTPQECAKQGVESAQTGSKDTDAKQVIQSIVNLLLFITGAVAVIMIVIGGIKYVTSAGEASQAKSAKDTILYAVIGLIVAIVAYAVVTFIINAFVK